MFFGNYFLWICRILGGGAGVAMLVSFLPQILAGPQPIWRSPAREAVLMILFLLSLLGLIAAAFRPFGSGIFTCAAMIAWLAVEGTPPGKPAFFPGIARYFMFHYIFIFGAFYALAGWMLGPRSRTPAPIAQPAVEPAGPPDSPNPPPEG
ncbi:MAG: hypothetical protein HRF49_00025 [bacterium]